ncbi:MAG TPA: HAD family hydrolase [Chloroflexota bacterium]|nr:HAD family hydrolase [Chloroflexota bacterium]
MIKALVFDFDGLILDTEGPEFTTWQEIYASHGCELGLATWAVTIGTVGAFDPYAELERQLGQTIDRDAVREQRRRRNAELLRREQVRPGVGDYLAGARQRGLKLAIASSSPRSWVAGHLERLGLIARFDCLTCADDVERVKPEPELYRVALATLGVPANEAVALEDSPNGILAAKRAGLFCVAVPNALTRQLPLDQADLRVDSLAELPLEVLLLKFLG